MHSSAEVIVESGHFIQCSSCAPTFIYTALKKFEMGTTKRLCLQLIFPLRPVAINQSQTAGTNYWPHLVDISLHPSQNCKTSNAPVVTEKLLSSVDFLVDSGHRQHSRGRRALGSKSFLLRPSSSYYLPVSRISRIGFTPDLSAGLLKSGSQ